MASEPTPMYKSNNSLTRDNESTKNDIIRRCQALRRISMEHSEIEKKYHELRGEVYKKYSANLTITTNQRRTSHKHSEVQVPSNKLPSGVKWFKQIAKKARDLRLMALSQLNEEFREIKSPMKETYRIRCLLEKCETKCRELLTNLANLDWELHEYEESIGQYHAEVESIMTQYNMELSQLYKRRLEIVRGTYEPSDEECLPIEQSDEMSIGLEDDFIEKMHRSIYDFRAETLISMEPRGMPQFWLKSLVIGLRQINVIQTDDWAPLSYLHDIRYYYDTWRDASPRKTTNYGLLSNCDDENLPPVNLDTDHRTQSLLFFFDKNPHFSNRILSKTLHIDRSGREGVRSFDGIWIMYREGCSINWFRGKNLTHHGDLIGKIVSNSCSDPLSEDQDEFFGKRSRKSPERASFFNFFGHRGLSIGGREARHQGPGPDLELDYEVFVHLRDFVVPNAVVAYSQGKQL